MKIGTCYWAQVNTIQAPIGLDQGYGIEGKENVRGRGKAGVIEGGVGEKEADGHRMPLCKPAMDDVQLRRVVVRLRRAACAEG